MKLLHEIQGLQVNPNLTHGMVRATRTSQSRRYTAALVLTATPRAIELEVTQLLEAETQRDAAEKALNALLAQTGMTVESAKAEHDAALKPWYDALFANEHAIVAARRAQSGGYSPFTDSDRAAAKAQTLAQGHQDPYVSQTFDILELEQTRSRNAFKAKRLTERALKTGDQSVLSWHKDVANAQKARAQAGHHLQDGYTIEILTDITITEI